MADSTRRAFVTAAVVALAGCAGNGDGNGGGNENRDGDGNGVDSPSSSPDNPAIGDVEQTGDLRLASPAFDDGEPIPEEYGHGERNVNPPLSIRNVPGEAESLTLVMDDPDAVEPAGKVWLHWLVWNIPAPRSDIPEGWDPTEAVEGENDSGNRGYDGPDPPDDTHTYRFKLYALDTTLDLTESASKRDVGAAMQGGVLAQTQLEGTYAP